MIGPTFGLELERAGMPTLPISWQADGTICGRENLTEQENATLDAVIAAHDPKKTVVPLCVSPLQMRKSLSKSGIRDQVEAYVKTLESATRDEWEYAIEVHRDNAAIEAGRVALGISVDAMDDLFRLAATL